MIHIDVSGRLLLRLAPRKGIRIPECKKFLIVESEIQEIFGFGLWNRMH